MSGRAGIQFGGGGGEAVLTFDLLLNRLDVDRLLDDGVVVLDQLAVDGTQERPRLLHRLHLLVDDPLQNIGQTNLPEGNDMVSHGRGYGKLKMTELQRPGKEAVPIRSESKSK